MPRGRPTTPTFAPCVVCGVEYQKNHHSQKYCSKACKRVQARLSGCESTERQYKQISGNWEKYFNRLVHQKGRSGLTVAVLLGLLESQGGKCALSGETLTCELVKGIKCQTNASIDKIDPKAGYVADNIQLVCAVLNKFRTDTGVEDFISWCNKVTEHALRK